MKLFIQTTFLLTLSVFTCLPLLAFAPVKIQSVDTSDFPKIGIQITVSGFAQGLNENDLFIYEDGYRVNYVKITPLEKNAEAVAVVFCLDSSKSIGAAFLKELKKSALAISADLSLSDIAVYSFDDNVNLLNAFNRDKRTINTSINKVSLRGSKTMLYDAIYHAISLIKNGHQRGIVVVFTDGKDEGSSVTIQDIGGLSGTTGIPVFFVTKSSLKIKPMERIAKLTGGGLVFTGNETDILRAVSSRLKGGYVINYHSFLKPDDREHSLEVRLSSGLSDLNVFYLNRQDMVFANFLSKENFYRVGLLFLFLLIFIMAFMFIMRRKTKTQADLSPQVKERVPSIVVRETAYEDVEIVEEYVPLTIGQGYAGAWFIKKDGNEAGKKIHIRGKEVTIGSSKECTIVIQDSRVSPFHAKVKNARGVFYLFDLVSDNGTYLNGSKLLRPKPLYDWDEISLGKVTLIFRGSKIID